jgi:hypothetical protein
MTSGELQDAPGGREEWCFAELAPLYALDGLTAEERQWVEAQSAALPELAEELADLQAATTVLAYAVPPAPMAADLKARLFERIGVDWPKSPMPADRESAIAPPLDGVAIANAIAAASTSEPALADPALADPILADLTQVPPSVASTIVRSQNLRWKPYRAPGISAARLHVDRTRREITAILRADPGASYPAHRHGGDEELYMLAGDLWFGTEQFGPGDYIRSQSGSHHGIAHSQGGCMLLVRTSIDNEYEELVLA